MAAGLTAIAQTPAAIWATGQPGEMQEVRQVTLAGTQAHAIPVIVAYNLPGRDACGKFSGSAGPGPTGYQTWINQLAAAIGGGDDIVIVEPDALPDLVRGYPSPEQAAERYRLLRYAMSRLGGLPHAQVYLDEALVNPSRPTEPFDISTIQADKLEAVEFYSGASQLPLKYAKLDARCGVLVLWTRRAP